MALEEQSELDWLAFRYVAGEMTADESVTFEARLADEQHAREAVSRAVELTERLAAAAPAPAASVTLAQPIPPNVASIWRRSLLRAAQPLAWMAAGAAAAVLILGLLGWPARPPIDSGPVTAQKAGGQRPAADPALWARLQSGGDWATPDLERWLEDSTTLAGNDREDALESPDVPSWIFADANSRQK